MTNRVVVYSKEGCPFCSLLKLELKKRRISFEEIDVSDDDVRAVFYRNSGTRSVPQLYVTAEKVTQVMPSGTGFGGYQETATRWDDITNLIS